MYSDKPFFLSAIDVPTLFQDLFSGILCHITLCGAPEKKYFIVCYDNQTLPHSHITRFPCQFDRVSPQKLAAMLHSLAEDSPLILFTGIPQLLSLPGGTELLLCLLQLSAQDHTTFLLLPEESDSY